ncbi:hypothetical protein EVB81_230 [Rhizobium phage RHph_I46]|uniref:Uncharacterized protein n=1 Tax=Rhizobium phage RHph_I1_9 TaxID=2509729 RepID=A0A7S5UWU4_9CAUD|nr:hypothetical protein PP936_gp228 [Rhizobium phage RHph_I1_9]QIG69799.1 hypothetical protein EVB81_230 [Rhizobium phage RHph_I46]QIG71080.1 hypothetical protein EVB92_230 [Rhizobium phage RHph_I9]QIG73665.1 hypothetical protein EVC04_228 [Rhizobium phage RHph_I1_9]QIG76419.1 hypothetical protein EVC25_230 [Rhizobium phage RHph_I34]
MFDRTHVHVHRPAGPSYVHVDEHRAPTDESVKLLKEFEKEAQEKVDKSVRLESNLLRGVVHAGIHHLSHDRQFDFHFELNGRRYKFSSTVPIHLDRQSRTDKLIGDISAQLAEELVSQMFKQSPEAYKVLFDER